MDTSDSTADVSMHSVLNETVSSLLDESFPVLTKQEPSEDEIAQAATSGEEITKFLLVDERTSDLSDALSQLKVGAYHCPTAHMDTLIQTHSIAVPPSIIDAHNHLKVSTACGIMPEINRAYFTIDNKLFIWDYAGGNKFACFSDLDQCISCVTLAKPKPNIFADNVHYLIVVATAVEVVLLGAVFSGDGIYGDLELVPSGFSVPTDNVTISKLVAIPNGRIFMCGQDGNLYEIAYAANSGWFSSKARKLNHSSTLFKSFVLYPLPLFMNWERKPIRDMVVDENCRFVFTLSGEHTISVFDLGMNRDGMSLKTKNERVQRDAITKLGGGVGSLKDKWKRNFRIISLHPIDAADSKTLCLLAVTGEGARIYFDMDSGNRVRVVHVRIGPKRLRTSSKVHRSSFQPVYMEGESPQSVHTTFYADRCLLLADSPTIYEDTLAVISSDPASRLPTYQHVPGEAEGLHESLESVQFSSRVKDICEMSRVGDDKTWNFLYASGQNRPLKGLSEYATQHVLPRREFACLTIQHLFFFQKKRTLDIIRDIITDKPASFESIMTAIIATSGPIETCAMLLHIACSDVSTSGDISSDDEKKLSYMADETLEQRATREFFRYAGRTRPQVANAVFGSKSAPSVYFSARHDALYTYASRLLRPAWKWTVVVNQSSPTGVPSQRTRFPIDDILLLLQPLEQFRRFLKKNLNNLLITAPLIAPPGMNPDEQREYDLTEVARNAENQSINALLLTLSRCIEGFRLLMYFQRNVNFPTLVGRIRSQVTGSRLSDITFRELVSSEVGEELVREIVNILSQSHSSQDNEWVQHVNKQSPHFFRDVDVLLFEGDDLVKAACVCSDANERHKILQQAYEVYFKAAQARTVRFPLVSVNKQLTAANDFEAIVKLSLKVALIVKKTLKANPTQGGLSVNTCYHQVLNCLNALFEQRMDFREMDHRVIVKRCVKAALECPDVKFHHILYTFFVEKDLRDYMHYLSTPRNLLEKFMIKRAEESEKYVDYLQHYFMSKKKLRQAAALLFQWAKNPDHKIHPNKRMEYLDQALRIARQIPPEHSQESTQLIGDIKTAVGLLQIQIQIATALQGKKQTTGDLLVGELIPNREKSKEIQTDIDHKHEMLRQLDKKMEQLSTEKLDSQQLFDIANVYELHFWCLALMCVLKNSDSRMIAAIWENMINYDVNSVIHRRRLRLVPEDYSWTDNVATTVREAANEFLRGGTYFPTGVIVEHLERTVLQYEPGRNTAFVVPLLLSCRVPPEDLLLSYKALLHKLLNNPVAGWMEIISAQVMLVSSILQVLEAVSQTFKSSATNRRSYKQFIQIGIEMLGIADGRILKSIVNSYDENDPIDSISGQEIEDLCGKSERVKQDYREYEENMRNMI